MQFKHPEILYALFALLIPIFIHLFQLQRFSVTPFTNVKFLKKIVLQTRKSATLKKWLVLLSRLLIFACVIIAFAQPYFSKNDSSKEWTTTIYLDNSISLSAKGERGGLLKRVVQEIVENIPDKGKYNLILNNKIHSDLSYKSCIEKLKQLDYSPVAKSLKTVLLQTKDIIATQKDKQHKFILISDFQKTSFHKDALKRVFTDFDQETHLVQVKPNTAYNISIDSVSVKENNLDALNLAIQISHQGIEEEKTLNLSALQKDIVLAKSTFELTPNTKKTIHLRIPNKISSLTLKIDTEDAFVFDNTYRVSFPEQKKINVLVIGKHPSFLEKIYTETEFNLSLKESNQVSFELIDKQELIVLNALPKTPQILGEKLANFVIEGGSLVLIPSTKSSVVELNTVFNKLNIGQLETKQTDTVQITKIHFSHPLIKNVFGKKVSNFQYPKTNIHFEGSLKNSTPILSFENKKPFISQLKRGKGNIFWIASPLDLNTSNFTKSPLIVPVFYNIGKKSSIQNQLSYRLGTSNLVEINHKLETNEVVHITGANTNFIPRQEIQSDKIRIFTRNKPSKSGFYSIKHNNKVLQTLAFNNPKQESNFAFFNTKTIENPFVYNEESIEKTLANLSSEQRIHSYFKWFVLLALFFVLIEILLLKYL